MMNCLASQQDYRCKGRQIFSQTDVSIAVVSQVFSLQPGDLLQQTRGRAGVALARQLAMYLSHVVAGQTLTEIGERFHRDRTTVAHACRLIESRRDDPSFDRIVELLEWTMPVMAQRDSQSFNIEGVHHGHAIA